MARRGPSKRSARLCDLIDEEFGRVSDLDAQQTII
jgi:hypothetical protein